MAVIRKRFAIAVDTLEDATEWLLDTAKDNPDAVGGSAAYYLRAFGITAGGAVLARAARTCLAKLAEDPQGDTEFLKAKIATARFYAENILPQVPGLFIAMEGGWQTLRTISDDVL